MLCGNVVVVVGGALVVGALVDGAEVDGVLVCGAVVVAEDEDSWSSEHPAMMSTAASGTRRIIFRMTMAYPDDKRSGPSAGRGMHPSLRLVLVRHGETAWTVSGQHTSRTDIPLTEAGRREATALAATLGDLDAGIALCSPRERAQETGRLAGVGARMETDPDLVEWDYGDFEGLTTTEIRAEHPGWSLWDDGVPGGEPAAEVGARADRVIERAAAAAGRSHPDVVLFSHGHFLRVLAARWLGLAPDAGRHLALSPASVSMLGHEREVPVILTWNVTTRA